MPNLRSALSMAADARRRELPIAIALTILVGGVGAAILQQNLAVGWAALIAATLMADAEIYRRAENNELPLAIANRLGVWSAVIASAYTSLPIALALDGAGAGLAAAMVLLIAGAVRFCGPGVSGGRVIAIAGVAPIAGALLIIPFLLALAGRPDWDTAFVAAIGGGALMAYVLHARLGAGRDASERIDTLEAEMKSRNAAYIETLSTLSAAREAADAANAAKSSFLTSMSHELRTPLNAIIGYAEILQEDAEAQARHHELQDIERVLSAARQLLRLINDILDLSKIESGRADIALADTEIVTLIKDAVATIGPAAAKNGNTVRIDIEPGLGAIRTDAFKLNQCLLNLLSNAAKFTEGGEIVVSARCESRGRQEFIRIDVADTGIGVAAEMQERLFTPFSQADVEIARRFGGSGLGLAITRGIMQALGGDVSLHSAIGQGATFTLSLPLRTAARPSLSRPAAAQPSHGLRRIVLLIDDDESSRDLATRSLARIGFEVVAASTGEEGLTRAQRLAPSLIVLDLNLPGIDGWQVLDALSAPETAAIPVIIHSVEDVRARALAAGACEHLTKPADRDVLAAAALRFARADGVATAPTASLKIA
jgi:signal transduction histidine kinase/CheY-like chemotaxis protein